MGTRGINTGHQSLDNLLQWKNSYDEIRHQQYVIEGGTGIFGFAVLDVFLIGFSVFVSKDFGFSVLVFNAVCGFFVF